MFGESKTLIVVSKDEMAINQFKKIVESDKERFSAVKIVAWTEKVWNVNKKSGNIESKVLYLGDIKGTDKLIPVIDKKFDSYGIIYGWAGKQAIVYTEMKELRSQKAYEKFFKEFDSMPVPDVLKKRVLVSDSSNEDKVYHIDESEESDEKKKDVIKKKANKSNNFIKKVGKKLENKAEQALDVVFDVTDYAGEKISEFKRDTFKDKKLQKNQMLFYGIIKMCENGLEEFINS